jgi:hypothetical protein
VLWLVLPVAAATPITRCRSKFDTDKTVSLTGSITEMKWSNPHGWLYIDVKDAKGEIQKWAVEFASPNQLYRRGVATGRTCPRQPSVVVVNGYPSRRQQRTDLATDVKLPDGRTLFAGNKRQAVAPA